MFDSSARQWLWEVHFQVPLVIGFRDAVRSSIGDWLSESDPQSHPREVLGNAFPVPLASASLTSSQHASFGHDGASNVNVQIDLETFLAGALCRELRSFKQILMTFLGTIHRNTSSFAQKAKTPELWWIFVDFPKECHQNSHEFSKFLYKPPAWKVSNWRPCSKNPSLNQRRTEGLPCPTYQQWHRPSARKITPTCPSVGCCFAHLLEVEKFLHFLSGMTFLKQTKID